jgi:hypothetical protein
MATEKFSEVTVYGLWSRDILARLTAFATDIGCPFEPRSERRRGTFAPPVELGVFKPNSPEQVRKLGRFLHALAKTLAKEPFSCQVNGDIVDLRRSVRTIQRELLEERSREDLPDFLQNPSIVLRALKDWRVSSRAANAVAEDYPRRGPHNMVIDT